MGHVTRTITLTSSGHHYGRRLPPQALGLALTVIPAVVRQSVSMAFRGRSSVRGPRPRWLKAAADLRFIDHQGDDASVLYFETPTLGEAAAELYQQQEFWSTRPDPSLTGLDLFGEVVRDVAAHNEDSDRFDKSLLGNLVGFKNVLNGTFHEVRLDPARPDTAVAVINLRVIRTAGVPGNDSPAATGPVGGCVGHGSCQHPEFRPAARRRAGGSGCPRIGKHRGCRHPLEPSCSCPRAGSLPGIGAIAEDRRR